MGTASLALLKGGKKSVTEELETAPEVKTEAPKGKVTKTTKPKEEPQPEPETPAEEEAPAADAAEGEEVQLTKEDILKMSSKDIDELVNEFGVEVPEDWKSRKVADKRTWIIDQFDQPEGDEAEQVEDAPENEQEPAQEDTKGDDTPSEPETVEEAPKKGKVTKSTKSVAKAGKDGEIIGPDEISNIVHEVENLDEDAARSLVAQLAEQAEVMYFKLGGVLSVIQAHGWFSPYASFREYVEGEYGINYRRAVYWVSIYNDISSSGVPWEKVKHLGWTKLKELAGILTKDNVDEWVKAVKDKNTLQIIEMVKNAKAKDAPKQIADGAAVTTTTMTFKVHDDQKEIIKAAIQKAKDASGTSVDTAALEFICLDFLGGNTKGIKDQLVKIGIDAALEMLADAYPEAEISVALPDTE